MEKNSRTNDEGKENPDTVKQASGLGRRLTWLHGERSSWKKIKEVSEELLKAFVLCIQRKGIFS